MGLAQTDNMPTTRYNGLRTAESILGTTIPILIGQHRLSWKLLWYGAFTSNISNQGGGGSGLSKSGTQYVYSASVVGSICMGPCYNFLAVWDSLGRFAMQTYTEQTTLPGSGSIQYTPLNQSVFKQDLGVTTPNSYSISANDYGSPATVTQSGTTQTPLTYTTNASPAAGQYTVINSPNIGPFSATSIAAASGNNTVITGTFTGGGSNAFAGYSVDVINSNFPANNGQFTVTASTTTTITVTNPNGRADTANITVNPISGLPVYVFNAAQAGAVVTVNYSAYRYQIQETELDVVPAGGTITVQYQAFQPITDVSVTYYPSGTALTNVGTTPTAQGQYNPNGGNYQFYVGSGPNDVGAAVTITYVFNNQNSSSDTNAPSTINLTFFGGELGQSPWSYLSSNFASSALGYSEVAYVASSGLYLGFSPVLPQYNFEVLGPYSFSGGIPDANPATAIYALLTEPIYKLCFPSLNIASSNYTVTGNVTSGSFTSGEIAVQQTTGATALLVGTTTGTNPLILSNVTGPANGTNVWVGQTSLAHYTPNTQPASSSVGAMWTANNFFISDILDSQSSLMAVISKWCEAGQAFITWDEGLLKFIPLCDTTTVNNGITYSPPTQPVIDLDDSDFVYTKDEDPIKIEQTPWQNRWNKVQARWAVRSNNYNADILQVQDEASVQLYGEMKESPQSWEFICTQPAALFAANMRLQRYSAIYTKYAFTLKSNIGSFLSPGDIITITDGLLGTSGTMFGRTPCRIVKMTDDPRKGIIIEAENYPWSVGASLLKNVQSQIPANTGDGPNQPPGNTTPLIFEVPNATTSWKGSTIYIFANGSTSNWGGFQAWVSFNGTDYNYYGQYTNPGRIGTLAASPTSAVFTLTQVAVSAPTATYSYSSFTGPIALVGATLSVSGFTNSGNNGLVIITAISGGASGTITVAATTQVPETHAATATGGFPTVSTGQNSLDTSNDMTVVMTQSNATLQSVTAADRDANVTLSAVVSPGQTFNETNPPGLGTVVGTPTSGGTTAGNSGQQRPSVATLVTGSPASPFSWTSQNLILGSSGFANVLIQNISGHTFGISSINNAAGGVTVYNGTITGGAGNAYAGYSVTITGSHFAQDNGIFNCTASSATSLTLANSSGVSDGGASITATISGGPTSQYANNIEGTSFPLNVPVGAGAIVGLQLTFNFYAASSFASYFSCQLVYKGSVIGVVNYAINNANPPLTSTPYTIGSLTSLSVWGLPSGYLTPTVLNDPSFGVIFYTEIASSSNSDTYYLNNVQLNVAWAAGGGGSGWTNASNISSTSSYCTASLVAGTLTQLLVGTNFNFNLPFGFVLDGVTVSFKAYVSSGTALVQTTLWADNLQQGAVQSTTITSTPTTYNVGSSTSLWGAESVEDLDTLNSTGFGVAFQVLGQGTATVSLNSVTVTLSGTSTNNLELVSYETVTLTSQNTYTLSSFRRGVMGSYPCDHPVGSQFARLDQASLSYQVPSNYLGNTIFFKFLSFNSYGKQLQSLSQVVAYDIPIGSLSPGAIDPFTGALRTGTPSWTVPQIEAATAAVHGSFGIQNIPAGFSLVGPVNKATGIPVWTPVITGGGGSAAVMNFFAFTVTSSVGANPWDYLEVDTSGGPVTITLPAATANPDTCIGIKKVTSDSNAITVATTGGDTVEIATISTYQAAFYYGSDGINSNWFVAWSYTVLPTANVGDIIRYNVNGDGKWDAVNYAQAYAGVYTTMGTANPLLVGLAGTGFTNNPAGPSWFNINPTATRGPGENHNFAAVASVNTLLGWKTGHNGNNSLFPFIAFYRWSFGFQLVATTGNVRYWMGLCCSNSGSSLGTNSTPILNTTKLATDTPNSSLIGFRWSSGTDAHWQAVCISAGVGQTTVDTGVAFDTSYHLFEICPNAAGSAMLFYIDNVLVATISTNLPPTAPVNESDALASMFWTADNKNTANVISANYFNMQLSLK